jgi:hypothetical protein
MIRESIDMKTLADLLASFIGSVVVTSFAYVGPQILNWCCIFQSYPCWYVNLDLNHRHIPSNISTSGTLSIQGCSSQNSQTYTMPTTVGKVTSTPEFHRCHLKYGIPPSILLLTINLLTTPQVPHSAMVRTDSPSTPQAPSKTSTVSAPTFANRTSATVLSSCRS